MTPTLTGAQPAVYTANGKTVRVLAQENDKAFALIDALDEGQRKQAILNFRVGDLVLGPGQDGKTIAPEGLKVSAMTEPAARHCSSTSSPSGRASSTTALRPLASTRSRRA